MEFPLTAIVIAIVLFVATKYCKATRKNYRRSPPLPPGPRKLPIIGHLHYLLSASSVPIPQTFRDLAARYGDLMLLRLGQVDFVVASSRDAAEDILRTQDLNFAYRPDITRIKTITYGNCDVAFSPYGPLWRQLRKICVTELFTAKRVASFARIRKEAVAAMVDGIASFGIAPVDLRQKLHVTISEILTKAAFRKECGGEFPRILTNLTSSLSGFGVADVFPSLEFVERLTGTGRRRERNVRQLDGIFDDIIEEHVARLQLNKLDIVEDEEEDLLDVLLKLRDNIHNLDLSITTDNVKGVIVDLFIAGTETSSNTIEWAMSELVKDPKAMDKAQKEVRKAANGRKMLEEEDLNGLWYLKQVITETLRLHPPIPLLIPRSCHETCQVQGNIITAGTRVAVNAWALGRDPRYWKQPEIFLPERFDDCLRDYKGTDFAFLPFGAGRRMCPGMNFGLASVELLLAQLLNCFDWELPTGLRPDELDMTARAGLTGGKKENFLNQTVQRLGPLSVHSSMDEVIQGRDAVIALADDVRRWLHLHPSIDESGWRQPQGSPTSDPYDFFTSRHQFYSFADEMLAPMEDMYTSYHDF